GGAKSPLWRQIIADCTDYTVVSPKIRDSTVIGAAMLAAVGTGVWGSYEEAIDNMFHIEERRPAIPENVAVFEERYEIFNKLMIAELASLLRHY
ncbi:MAG: FGGY-family carbohydrate kinase, partial [Candidatus Hodarchaeota archaeon]